jgi:hypothetical protein
MVSSSANRKRAIIASEFACDRQGGRPSETATPQPPWRAIRVALAHGESGNALEGPVLRTRLWPPARIARPSLRLGPRDVGLDLRKPPRRLGCAERLAGRARTLRLDIMLPNDIALLSEYDLDNYVA